VRLNEILPRLAAAMAFGLTWWS